MTALGGRYADRAVRKLAAYLQSSVPTALRAIETEEELAANYLVNPVSYLRARAPLDARSPAIYVFDEDGRATSQRERLFEVDCTVGIVKVGPPDLVTLEDDLRRYLSAVINVISADPRLGTTTGVSAFITEFRAQPLASATWQARGVGVTVLVHSP